MKKKKEGISMYNVNRAFNLLKSISFERLGGSKEELEAAKIIQEEIKKSGGTSTLEEFEVDYSEIKCAKLLVNGKEIPCTGVKMSGNTNGMITKKLVYVEDCNDCNLINVKDCIVLINGRMILKYYKKLINKGIAGFISYSGSVYDEETSSDLNETSIREVMYQHGKIPGVNIRAKEAQNLILNHVEEVSLQLEQVEGKTNSRNVVAVIEGSLYKDEKIAITAHYDSVKFSTGAYDNASGSVGIMELYHYFLKNTPKRTMVFIWCGSEEMGLLGSKAYCKQHQEEIDKFVFCLNIDMIGVVLGKEIACCTSEMTLVNYLDYLGKEIGIAISARQGVYSSDSTPFADCGVPSVSFARISSNGGAEIHSRKDVLDHMSAEAFSSSLKVMLEFLIRLDKSIVFPVKRIIPENMKLELDYYNSRKERP